MTDSKIDDNYKDDPTKGMSYDQLVKKYGTEGVKDKNYMDGIRKGLDKTHSYSGGFWWPRA